MERLEDALAKKEKKTDRARVEALESGVGELKKTVGELEVTVLEMAEIIRQMRCLRAQGDKWFDRLVCVTVLAALLRICQIYSDKQDSSV